MIDTNDGKTRQMTRRSLVSAAGAAALSFTLVRPGAVRGTAANSRIKAGVIGLGGRGRMITGMVQKHGGYELVALADYFDSVVNSVGEQFNVPKDKCFSGLSGLKV